MLFRGVRRAVRALRTTPGLTAASILILALGIGASTAVFSVVNGLLLRPLPVADQDRLVRITKNDRTRGFDHYALFYPEYVEWSRRSRELESMAAFWAWGPWDAVLLTDEEPKRIEVSVVSGNFFDVLGASTHVGRTLEPADETATAVPPIVLSYRAWQDRFGMDPAVLGTTVPLRLAEKTSFQIVGVMLEGFDLFSGAEAWTPVTAVYPDWAENLRCECDLVGRIAGGSTPERALAELQAIHESLVSERPETYRRMDVVLTPLLDSVVGDAGSASLLAFGAAALLLAIALVNLTALSVIRASGLTRDMSVRLALGARTASLVRERLTESLLLCAAALTAGLLLAHLGIELFLLLKSAELPRAHEIVLDVRVAAFSTTVVLIAVVTSGLLPVLVGSTKDPILALKGKTVGAPLGRLLHWMAAGEIALALPLLVGGGLLLQTLLAQKAIDRGFRSESLLSVQVHLSRSTYSSPESRLAFVEELVRRVEALPGVESATPLVVNPGSGWTGVSGPLAFEGQSDDEARDNPMTNIEMVAPNYFRTMGIPLMRGRVFDPFDRLESERVAIVSEATAATYWPGQDPIGKMLGYREVRNRVVGVVADTRYRDLTRNWPTVYYPMRQNPFSSEPQLNSALSYGVLAVRTRLQPESLVRSIRSAIRSLDDEVLVDRAATMDHLLDLELQTSRFQASATSTFAFIALLLAATGVYSVFAAFVTQRIPELGLRLALGATPARLQAMVLKRSVYLSLLGVFVGITATLWLSRFLEGFLYGVAPTDSKTIVGAVMVIGIGSLAAAYVPARRASRVDPLILLRHE